MGRTRQRRAIAAILALGGAAVLAGGALAAPTGKSSAKVTIGSALRAALAASNGQTFFVSPSGSDGAAGSASAPWSTIGHALESVNPGDTVLVRAGTYTDSLTVTRSGSASAVITLAAATGERPVLTGRLKVAADYIRVTGFLFDGQRNNSQDVSVYLTGNHIEVSGNVIRNGFMSGIYAGTSGAGPVDDLRIVGNTIVDNGTHVNLDHGIYCGDCRDSLIAGNLITGNKAAGIQLYPDANGNVVTGNTIARNGRFGVIIGSESSTTSSRNLLTDNVIAFNGETGIRAYWGGQPGSGNTVTTNLVYGNPQGNLADAGHGIAYGKNLQANPLFTADFHLRTASPAIDAGSRAYAPLVDLAGLQRITAPDLGAFELR
jgi:parallel beta-helix repeat protein